MEFNEAYKLTVLVLGLTGFLVWLQLALVDVLGIRMKHTPGYAIEQNHESLLFRANRTLSNSNESIGILILLSLFAILSSANPAWLNGFAIAYLVGRVCHMACYYLNLKLLRSASFAISFVALLGMFIVGILSWL